MDYVSMAVIGTSGALAYLQNFPEAFTAAKSVKATPKKGAATKGVDPAVARSLEFLKIRLQTMLAEGTLSDVKAVCRQIEDAGFQDKIPDYARAQNIIKSVPNPCGKPQIIKDPTRYQNQPMTDFVHNNFVPFFRGRHTQNMVGTGVPSGNWDSPSEGSTVVSMNRVTGNDPFTKPSRSTRDPESRVFGIRELGTDTVWGSPLVRPDLDRYVDATAKRPDLRATESIKIGTGMDTPAGQNVGNRGFHEMYRPIEDAQRTVNSKNKFATSAASPAKGKFAGGAKTSGQIPFAGGLKPATESFGQNDAEMVQKYQGSGFVVKKCNESNAQELGQFATTGPGKTRFTGEYSTEQMHRPETKRGQTTPNVNTHYPGLITGEVKRITNTESDIVTRESYNHNIRNFKTSIDREKTTRSGLPTGAMGNSRISGHDAGPGRFYVNDTYTDNGQLPTLNVTSTAGVLGALGISERNSQRANTTNRELFGSDKLLGGARGNQGHRVGYEDAPRTNHRESTSTDAINYGSNLVNQGTQNSYAKGQRNNLRSVIPAEDRPAPGRTNDLSSVKVRVGGYQLNDIRAMGEVSDRPQANIATNPEMKLGQTKTNYNKIVETYSDPRIGKYLPGGYDDKPEDSREACQKNNAFDGV